MNKEEMKAEFEKNVQFIQRNIPPDDIYIFAEQTFMAAMFFLTKWSKFVDVLEECEKDPVTKKWVHNLIGLQIFKDQGIDFSLDLDLKSLEPDENNN